MKILTPIVAIVAAASSAEAAQVEFFAAPAYQEDFSTARLCEKMIYGHLVWKGEKAFYFQTEKADIQDGLLTKGGGVTSVYMSNTPESLMPFRLACR